ncbi:hypothetical protein JQ595_07770 [Bradyrhizobium japonicum]|uniref:hypothetical protein n=1 Tax=Bradyrhizobium japonicum TaxID=375 RepID=UPI001BA79C71|nr:hypothetical protein [Bradyrhizobium japonicum]MBR0728645.1 hypothetical protein [Bradyrhizobium japonicum]
MSKTDLAERLSQMVDAADRDGAAQQAAIVRRHAADGMLQSGNFFVAENDALNAIYESALHAMVDHALSVTAPSVVASAVKTSGLELESKFLGRFEGILGGSASGNASADASQKLLSDFRARLREKLNQAVSDAENNAAGKPVRGWQGWIIRYGWNGINTVIALVALYLSWIKK